VYHQVSKKYPETHHKTTTHNIVDSPTYGEASSVEEAGREGRGNTEVRQPLVDDVFTCMYVYCVFIGGCQLRFGGYFFLVLGLSLTMLLMADAASWPPHHTPHHHHHPTMYLSTTIFYTTYYHVQSLLVSNNIIKKHHQSSYIMHQSS